MVPSLKVPVPSKLLGCYNFLSSLRASTGPYPEFRSILPEQAQLSMYLGQLWPQVHNQTAAAFPQGLVGKGRNRVVFKAPRS